MEVCGGQTHTIVRQGLDELLEPAVEMIHGPGCPVCVTPLEQIDKALAPGGAPRRDLHLLRRHAPGAGQRVRPAAGPRPGRERAGGLFAARRAGAGASSIPTSRWCSSPSGSRPRRRPTPWRSGAHGSSGCGNFSVLVSHVTVPPAMIAILDAPDNRVQGFLAAGHVCTVMGWTEYEPIAARYQVPIVVTGFEPVDILEGIALAVRQLEEGRHEVENQYVRAVRRDGHAAGPRPGPPGLRAGRPEVAGHRQHSAERARPPGGVRRLRRRAAVRARVAGGRGAGRVPGR